MRSIQRETLGLTSPNLKNFQYMVENVGKSFGAKKEEVLKVAQSLYHDHRPAKKFGLRPSVWIKRGRDDAAMGGKIEDLKDQVSPYYLTTSLYTSLNSYYFYNISVLRNMSLSSAIAGLSFLTRDIVT